MEIDNTVGQDCKVQRIKATVSFDVYFDIIHPYHKSLDDDVIEDITKDAISNVNELYRDSCVCNVEIPNNYHKGVK